MPLASPVLQTAQSTLASKGRTFYWASFLLNAGHAAKATRLYSVCRYIDDLADEASSIDSAHASLAQVTEDIQTSTSQHLVIQDGIALLQTCDIDKSVLLALVAGVASDLGTVRIQDEAHLLQYCYQVAGTVGLMMSKVLDTHASHAMPHAIDLGIAMQLTNICRDVSADALLGRCYLPRSMVGLIELDSLANPPENKQADLSQVTERLLDLADVYYASGEQGLAYLPLGVRSGILVASRVYRAIGLQLRQRNGHYWEGRAVVPPLTKLRITLQALLSMPLKRHFWKPHKSHDSKLHDALRGFIGNATPAS